VENNASQGDTITYHVHDSLVPQLS
jgi:hypothetical protein